MLRSMIYMIHHRLSLLYNKLYVTEHNMNSLVSHRSINFAKREKNVPSVTRIQRPPSISINSFTPTKVKEMALVSQVTIHIHNESFA